MKSAFLFSVIFILGSVIHAQNLVKNPDFEEHYHLPDLKYEFDELHEDSAFICKNWHRAKGTTPDYHHVDAMHFKYSIPFNTKGCHPVESGKAYIGLVPFMLTGIIEPIAGELIEPLEAGKEYSLKFKYRFARGASFYYLNKIEVFITDNIDWFKTGKSVPFYQDLISPGISANVQLIDTLVNDGDWHEMNGVYEAKGGEQYIVFGVFYQGKKYEKIITEYLNNNFTVGWNMHRYERFERKHRKHLIIHRNPYYNPQSIFASYKIAVEMETNKDIMKTVSSQKTAYYFLDQINLYKLKD